MRALRSDHLKFTVQASFRLSSGLSLGCAGRLNGQSHRTPAASFHFIVAGFHISIYGARHLVTANL